MDSFRQHAHALLDKILEDHPGTDALLIVVDGPAGLDAASIPSALSVKEGMTTALGVKVFGGIEE